VRAPLARAFPYCLPGALCAGLAGANLVRVGGAVACSLFGGAIVLALADGVRAGVLTGVVAAILAGGWWWGSLRLDALDHSVLAAYVDRGDDAIAVVTGPPRVGHFEIHALARVERFGGIQVGEPVLLELPVGRSPPQGAKLELTAVVGEPRGPKNGFDERAWLRRQGIHVVVRGSNWRLRASTNGLRGERRAIVSGIVAGADEGLSDGLRDSFRASGLYHLLAVSGQNVVFLAAGVMAFAWLLAVPRLAAEVGVIGVIAAYTLAVGWQPSVVRAAVAGSLASLAWLAARPRDRWYCLLLGAAVLLSWNPYTVLDPGFELSFAAVAAIFLLVPRLLRWLEGYPVPPLLAQPLAVSTACGVVTAPLLWLRFGKVPLYSVLANALAEPAVAPLLGLGLVAAVLHPLLPAASTGIAWLNGWLAAYLAALARAVAGLPHAQLASGRALVLTTLAAAGLWILVRPKR
jgi:competence protein ComEC